MMAEVESRGFAFILDANSYDHINAVARWATQKGKFGLLLSGSYGNGKSTLVRALQSVTSYVFESKYPNAQPHEKVALRMVNALHVSNVAKTDDDAFERIATAPFLAIDDVGLEPAEVLNYGNVINPLVQLITYRYDNMLPTVITTNLTPAQIREHYGERIADRFVEFFDRIVFTNPSYRK